MSTPPTHSTKPIVGQTVVSKPSIEDPSNTSTRRTETEEVPIATDGLHRRLSNRQVQLVAIGGSIGTAVFVSMGGALQRSGPGSLLLAFVIYTIILSLCNNCMAEMSVYMPVSGGFVRLAGKWVDDAFGFMAGWNFFFYQVFLIPFEIVALTLVVSYWNDKIPVYAICVGCIILYGLINVFAVGVYGEAEFYLSGGKVILLAMLLAFTLITMAGGNPQHDAYGFRAWSAGYFAEYVSTGPLGKFEGFLSALWTASFTCVGPEYVSMMAAEAKHPRIYVKTAFKAVYWRIWIFFVGSALAAGIVVSHKDPTLVAIYTGKGGSTGSAAASPYIIAMGNLGIGILPHVVTFFLATTIFSAGSAYTYCSTRTLYGLALEGRAPRFLTKTTKKGAPIYCLTVVMAFPLFSLLQLSSSSAKVLDWLISLTTAATIIDYIVICVTYNCFHRACKTQNFDRSRLPYIGRFQPYSAYIGLVWMTCVVICYGYRSLSPFDPASFFIHYTMVLLAPLLFCLWKCYKGTKTLRPDEVDLVWDAPRITAYEELLSEVDPPIGFLQDIANHFSVKRLIKRRDATAVV
ncbi:hypothetical protein CTAM01_17004 [Colletotrichum tamarilloi]|uniref:Amino acid permease/ SLC12A domain-containing protein n=1 Tax=Colletotrichum tamarilloi TaxID=1209934 RepID=A0ABQ9QGX1_9PEZI|nr:uncharacterized protein CTAM01_17004 [Colletotrichum tamarilloi]KAK1466602.1 hypothetical protein CTAM01_17004 [Colletotrichum tamarilloi]